MMDLDKLLKKEWHDLIKTFRRCFIDIVFEEVNQ